MFDLLMTHMPFLQRAFPRLVSETRLKAGRRETALWVCEIFADIFTSHEGSNQTRSDFLLLFFFNQVCRSVP